MFCTLQEAVEDFRLGKFLVLVDDQDRENEGDLITAAQFITPAKVNLMGTEARGMFLFAMTDDHLRKLGIQPVERRNASRDTPNLGMPFDAREGVATGISAADRATTVLRALEDGVGPDDFVIPGHVLPLRARKGGLRERQGHTEASVQLAALAGLFPAAVMSEVLNEEGDMAKGEELKAFAERLDCRLIDVEQIRQAS